MSKYEGEMIMKVNPYVDDEYRTEIKRLREENAKLEGKLADLTSEYYELENFKSNEINKAKEIINKLISVNRKEWVYSDVREEAEQFLKESE